MCKSWIHFIFFAIWLAGFDFSLEVLPPLLPKKKKKKKKKLLAAFLLVFCSFPFFSLSLSQFTLPPAAANSISVCVCVWFWFVCCYVGARHSQSGVSPSEKERKKKKPVVFFYLQNCHHKIWAAKSSERRKLMSFQLSRGGLNWGADGNSEKLRGYSLNYFSFFTAKI